MLGIIGIADYFKKIETCPSKAQFIRENSLSSAETSGNGVFGKNTVGAAEKYVPKNIKMVNSNYLKKQGIDAHALKTEFIGKKNIAYYDIYVDKDSGMLWLFRKGGIGEPMPLYKYIK